YHCLATKPYVMKLDDKGNWVRKFDRQSSVAQPLTVPPPSLHTARLLEVINGLSFQVDARFNVLTTHFDDCYNHLDERINVLDSRFPPPSDD
ncbi:hypothetical protein J1N35_004784, partial [Gossypium stocksii]